MRKKRTKIVYGLLAVLCFGVLAATALGKEQGQTVQAYDMVMLGDSILGKEREETSVSAQVEERLGIRVFNGALGGTCMGRLEETGYPDNVKDVLSFASIAKSIVAHDFTVQNRVKLTENGTEHFPQVLEELSQVDFSQVEVLLIGYGVNDYHAGENIYPKEDNLYDETTYVGALRSGVRMLQSAYPKLRIVLLTPTYTWYPELGLTCEEYILGGNELEDYMNAAIRTAEELGIECIDLYHLYSHDEWEKWKKYTEDGLHPNEKGREKIAEVIVEFFAD